MLIWIVAPMVYLLIGAFIAGLLDETSSEGITLITVCYPFIPPYLAGLWLHDRFHR